MNTSAGRRPGVSPRIPFFSNEGFKRPSSAIFPTSWRNRLWRVIKSPDLLQIIAWSPKGSINCEHEGQTGGAEEEHTGIPKRRATAVEKTFGFIIVSEPSVEEGTAVTQAPACSAWRRSNRWRSRELGAALRREKRETESKAKEASCWDCWKKASCWGC